MRTGSQPVAVGLAENPWPGQRGNHQMERVRRARAVRRGIGERLDDLQLLDDRARPPVRDDQRQRVLVLGANVDEMDVKPVDLGDEVRQSVQFRLTRAPVVVCPPVARELLHHREPHALRVVGDRLAFGPPGRVYAPAQLGELRLRKTDLKRADSGRVSACLPCAFGHGYAPSSRVPPGSHWRRLVRAREIPGRIPRRPTRPAVRAPRIASGCSPDPDPAPRARES